MSDTNMLVKWQLTCDISSCGVTSRWSASDDNWISDRILKEGWLITRSIDETITVVCPECSLRIRKAIHDRLLKLSEMEYKSYDMYDKEYVPEWVMELGEGGLG